VKMWQRSGLGRVSTVNCHGFRRMSRTQFTNFLSGHCFAWQVSTDGSIHQRSVWMASLCGKCSQQRWQLLRAQDVCVWNKTNAGMGNFTAPRHELVFVWRMAQARILTPLSLASMAGTARMCGTTDG